MAMDKFESDVFMLSDPYRAAQKVNQVEVQWLRLIKRYGVYGMGS